MSMTVELIYHKGCPQVPVARRHIKEALQRLSLPRQWREWDTDAPDAPAHVRQRASPTILVRGQEVGGTTGMAGGGACRVGGAPSAYLIAEAISKAATSADPELTPEEPRA